MRRTFFLLALIVAGALLVCAKDDETSDEMSRKLDIKADADKVVIKSETREGKDKSRIDFEIKTQDGELEFRVNYFTKTSDSKARFQARVQVNELVEFKDTNGQQGYQQGDQVIRSFNFDQDGNSMWAPLSCGPSATGYDCSASALNNEFRAVVHLVGDVVDVDGMPVRPTSLKFDIYIGLSNKRNDTSMALLVKTRSKEHQVEQDKSDENDESFTEDNEKQVSFGDNAFFSWVTTATLVNEQQEIAVLNSNLQETSNTGSDDGEEGETSQQVVFSFDTTSTGPIEWDPKLGATPSAASGLAASTYLMVVAFLLAMIKLY